MKANSEARSLKPIGKPATLALADLTPSPGNRATANDDDLKGLASSIKTVGLLYPVIVRPDPEQKGLYRIVAGERRWRAMKLLRIESAPCVVLSSKEDEAQAEVVRVVENHQRRNLEPLEEAAAVQGLLDIGLEPEAVARSLGRSRAWVARRASLTELSERWLTEVRNPASKLSQWPPSHLEVISRFPPEVQDRILQECGPTWQWNVPAFRDLTAHTGQFMRLLSAAPWKPGDEALCPEAGACDVCPKRSSHAPDLFSGELNVEHGNASAGDVCLDEQCWRRKSELFLTRRAEDLRKEHPGLLLLSSGEEDGVDLEETFGTEVLSAAEFAPSRKSDGNAVPALVVGGPGMGRVKWVQPVQSGRAESGIPRRERSTETETPAAEKTPEEKRKPYDKRRRQVVIDAVKRKLEALAAESHLAKTAEIEGGPALTGKGLTVKTLVLLAALLGDHGWRSRASDGALAALPEGLSWESLGSLKNHETGTGETRESVLQLCWKLLRLVVGKLAVRLSVAPGEPNNHRHYDETETLCAMLGFDLAALRAEAAEAIPYAKLWREEVTDEWAGPKSATGEGEEATSGNGRKSQ